MQEVEKDLHLMQMVKTRKAKEALLNSFPSVHGLDYEEAVVISDLEDGVLKLKREILDWYIKHHVEEG